MKNEAWDIGKQNEHIFMSLLICFSHLQDILHILQDFPGVSREGENAIETKEGHESEREAHFTQRKKINDFVKYDKVDQVNCLGLQNEKKNLKSCIPALGEYI